MRLSAAGAAFVRHHEGFVDHAYLDPVGVLTIGVGFTWGSDSFREWWERNRPGQPFTKSATMTRAEADGALRFMVDMEYGKAVNRFLGKAVRQHVFDGMVSPVYNLGPGSLKWKWAAAVKAGNLNEAATRLRNTGTTARGKKLRGLVIRRKEEAELLAHGDYEIGVGKVYAEPMDDGVLVRGERGAPVIDLQKRLKALGHYAGAVDGIFGHGTEAAVMAFQRAHGMRADGYAGPKTLDALADKPAQPPESAPAPSRSTETNKPSQARGWAAAIIAIGAAIFAFLKANGWI